MNILLGQPAATNTADRPERMAATLPAAPI